MIKLKEFPNKEFATKEEVFAYLKKHKDTIISAKKQVRYSDKTKALSGVTELKSEAAKGLEVKENHSVHVINTTKILDSHRDLHINNIWNKSVKEQKGNIYFLANHNLAVGSVIAYPKDVNMKVVTVSFKDLGFDYEGETQALIFEIDKSSVRHDEAKYIIENNIEIEHSVRMAYVKIDLAVNSDSDDYKAEKKLWDKYYPEVANKEVADEIGYMWIVKEAKIVDEGSMVLKGSNHVTPMQTSSGENQSKGIVIEEEDEGDEIKDNGIIETHYPYLV